MNKKHCADNDAEKGTLYGLALDNGNKSFDTAFNRW